MKRVLALAFSLGLGACRPAAVASPSAARERETPKAAVASSDRLDGTRFLARDAELAASLGASPLQITATDAASDGDRVGGFVTIPEDQCALAYARGSPGIEDLDLYAYADDGTSLAVDEASDPAPAVVLCPPHPYRAYFVARVASGRGIVAIGVHAMSPNVAARVGKALGARGRPGEELGRIEAWPGLDQRVNDHRNRIGGHWEEIRRVAVQADARAATRLSAPVDGGRCLDVYVVPGEDLSQVDLTVLDGDDRVLTRAAPFGHDRSAIICSPMQTPLAIELRPHAGQGLCAVVLARSAPGAEREISGPFYSYRLAPESDLAIERAERARPLKTLGYADANLIGSGTADVGRRQSFALNLPAGCTRLDIVGGRPLAGITADVWDASGDLVSSGLSGDGPTLFVCGKPSRGRIDLEALNRPGPFAIEMRRERSAVPALVARPLAAARVLAALNGRSDPVTAAAAADAHAFALDPSSLKTFDLALASGRCGDVVAALDAGGSGLDMRLVDDQSGEELTSARGRLLVETHVCAAERPRTLRCELRLSSGKADALVVMRLAPILPGR